MNSGSCSQMRSSCKCPIKDFLVEARDSLPLLQLLVLETSSSLSIFSYSVEWERKKNSDGRKILTQ